MRLLYFGKLGDVAGCAEEEIALPETIRTTHDLRQWVDQRFGASGSFLDVSVRLALNTEIVSGDKPVSAHDEIAFLPPVGGG